MNLSERGAGGIIEEILRFLPAAAYLCQPDGLITAFNRPASELWGRCPRLQDPLDRYCGSYRLFAVDGTPIAHAQCWMALALQENRGFNQRQIVVERPDGSRRLALAHANPLHGPDGTLSGAINVLVDITERAAAAEDTARLPELLEQRVRERTAQLEAQIERLQAALRQGGAARESVVICAWCRKIRHEPGEWEPLESFLSALTTEPVTHGICPSCSAKAEA